MSGAVELPRWRSHKTVWADKIVGTTSGTFLLLRGMEVEVSQNLRNRLPFGVDPVGGYYVRYEGDGFESWSPAEAFEQGYTRIVP